MADQRQLELQTNQPLSPMAYVTISACGFLVTIGLLFLYVFKARDLLDAGISGQVFYVLLLPLGLSSAAFVFGAMRSYGVVKGKRMGLVFEFGGPIVAAALVVVGGFYLVPASESAFDLTIRAVEDNGRAIRSGGTVSVHLPSGIRQGFFGGNGEATLKSIPADHLGETTFFETSVPGFKTEGQTEIALGRDVALIKHTRDYEGTPDGVFNKRKIALYLLEVLMPLRVIRYRYDSQHDPGETDLTQYTEEGFSAYVSNLDLDSQCVITEDEKEQVFDVLFYEAPTFVDGLRGTWRQVFRERAFEFKQKVNLMGEIETRDLDENLLQSVVTLMRSNYIELGTALNLEDVHLVQEDISDFARKLEELHDDNLINPFEIFYPM